VRDDTGARIVFPGPSDSDKEAIVLIGKKEDVQKAKEILNERIESMVRSSMLLSKVAST